jgi:hypothetical protein
MFPYLGVLAAALLRSIGYQGSIVLAGSFASSVQRGHELITNDEEQGTSLVPDDPWRPDKHGEIMKRKLSF